MKKLIVFLFVAMIIIAGCAVASETPTATPTATETTDMFVPTSTPPADDFVHPDIVSGDTVVSFERTESCPPETKGWRQIMSYSLGTTYFTVGVFVDPDNNDVYTIIDGEQFYYMDHSQMATIKNNKITAQVCFSPEIRNFFWK